MRAKPILTLLAVALAVAGAAQPQIGRLSHNSLARNGRLIIEGSGFGTVGTVTIGNWAAVVTQWHEGEIHAYVPYQSAPGSTSVVVINADGRSKPVRLQIIEEAADGNNRVLWRFQTDRWMTRQFIKVDSTNRIYTSDELGLYALTAEGNLLWFSQGSGGRNPTDVGPDGTLYTGVILGEGPEIVRAINRDGSIKWEFVPAESGLLIAGPNVGQDGNIYGLQEVRSGSGIGAFSLTPDGQLRWSNVGDPPLGAADAGNSKSEIVFARDQLYIGILFLGSSSPNVTTYSFDLDGNQIWQSGPSGLGLQLNSFPRVDPFGRVIGRRGQTGLMAVMPDGSQAWSVFLPGGPQLLLMPTIDSNGNSYIDDWVEVDLWSLDSAGNIRWARSYEPSTTSVNVGISPNDSTLINCAREGFTGQGYVRALNPDTGQEQWREELEPENGIHQASNNLYPAFSTSAQPGVVYVTTFFSHVSTINYGYLYAIRYGDEAQTIAPAAFMLERGILLTGTLQSLFASDDDRLIARPGIVLSSSESPVTLLMEGASSYTSPAVLQLVVESSASANNIQEVIEAYNFMTGAWDIINAANLSVSDTIKTVALQNPADYIGPKQELRTRIRCRQVGPILSFPWQARFDEVSWRILP